MSRHRLYIICCLFWHQGECDREESDSKITALPVYAPVVGACVLWCGVDKDGVRELAKAIEILSLEEAAADIARPNPDNTLRGQMISWCARATTA